MAFGRYVPEWSGFPGGPGFSVFHFNGSVSQANADLLSQDVADLFFALRALIPTNVTITYPGEMSIHSDDGTLTDVVALTVTPAATDCTGVGAYAAPAGVRIAWDTGQIVGGRRVQGRTYIVPTILTVYESDGSLTAASMTTFDAAAEAYIDATQTTDNPAAIWSPPKEGPPPVAGAVSLVTAARIPDQVSVLRSRRD